MKPVQANWVICKTSDKTKEYKVTQAGEIPDDWDIVRFLEAKDSELEVPPAGVFKLAEAKPDKGKELTTPPTSSGEVKTLTTTDVFELLSNPHPDLQWTPLDGVEVDFDSIHEPGTLEKVISTAISTKLRQLCKELVESDDQKAMSAFILACLQLMLTVTTSKDVEDDDSYALKIPVGAKPTLRYSAVRDAVVEGCKGFKVANPLRQYFRLFSATTSNLIANGKLKVNSKVAMQHGVTKEFLPYTFDFFRPDYRFCNDNQILAWQQASSVAYAKKKTSNEQVIHNTIELGKSGADR